MERIWIPSGVDDLAGPCQNYRYGSGRGLDDFGKQPVG